jgi:hypothetical protein
MKLFSQFRCNLVSGVCIEIFQTNLALFHISLVYLTSNIGLRKIKIKFNIFSQKRKRQFKEYAHGITHLYRPPLRSTPLF